MYTSLNSGDDNYSGDSGHDRETDAEIGNNEDRKVKAEAKSNRKVGFSILFSFFCISFENHIKRLQIWKLQIVHFWRLMHH